MQTLQSIAANTWEDFKCLMGLRKARGSKVEYRAREVITPKKKKEEIVTRIAQETHGTTANVRYPWRGDKDHGIQTR